MTANTTEFGGSDKLALDYIKKRGYASYSSLVNVRDKREPRIFSAAYFDLGKEVHSRFLEKKILNKQAEEDTPRAIKMVKSLENHPVVSKIMKGAKVEQQFHQPLWGLQVLGYIDILPPKLDVGDLKTTRHKNVKVFAAEMDFLQAALYLAVTKRKSFHYVGIQKSEPYKVLLFNVNQYPEKLQKAHDELKYLIKYVKKQTGL